MFLGFAVLAAVAAGAAGLVALTAVLVPAAGFWPVAFTYAGLVLAGTAARVAWKLRALGHGAAVVREWDTDNADLEGSTARYGTPHDPYSFRSARRPHLDGRP
jgi:hypothetical protein